MKTAVITGAAGFLGSHLAENLISDGWEVIGIDNLVTGRRGNLKSLRERFTFVEADVIPSWDSWARKIPAKQRDSVQKVFHFASIASPPHYQKNPVDTMWVNSLGLQEALKFADQTKAHVTFASTSEVYGDPEVHPQVESYRGNVNTFGPRACYDEGKRFGEALIYSWNQMYGTDHGMLRIFNTYGPRMNPHDGRVVVNFLGQGLAKQPLTIYGDGRQTRSFCYVSDLVDGILRYSDRRLSTPINLGNDQEYSILELAEVVRGLFPNDKLIFEFHALPKDDPLQRRPVLTLAKEKLGGWMPKVPLKEGLAAMLKSLREEI